MVGPGQALGNRPEGRRPHREPDPRTDAQPCLVAGLDAQRVERGRRPLLHDRRGGALGEAPQIVAESGRDRAPGAALQPLEEAADRAYPILEGEPGVALAPLRVAGQLDVAALDPERGHPTRRRGQPARRGHGVQEGEPHRRCDGGGAQVILGPLEDRREGDELPGRVQVEQLVREGLAPLEGWEAVPELVPDPGALAIERALDVERVHGRLALLAAAELVPAHGASVVLADRARPGRMAILVG